MYVTTPATGSANPLYNTSQATVTAGGEPPKKYVKINGVTQINPEWKAYKEANGEKATTTANPNAALPVVSNMDDHAQLNEVSTQAGYGQVPLSPATDATIEMMQEPEVTSKVGLSAEGMVDGLGAIFAKHEAPMGLMNKLMELSEFDGMEFMVDDSGSMGNQSDTKDVKGRTQTRWEEAHARLREMIELLAYVPTPTITICFLNRKTTIDLKRTGQTPDLFIQGAYKQMEDAFKSGPSGSTPARERLQESFSKGAGKRIARYFFCDGTPNGGDADQKAIATLVKNRANPQGNPLTLLSCTNEDDQAEWMKNLEEVAPYCAECDDFADEATEVRRDQGDALPFTKGFHLICQLVGAMNPDDLDSMDESVPFTKTTLDNLLGVQTSPQEYRHYFDEFKLAQQRRKVEGPADTLKKNANWEVDFQLFVTTPLAKMIPSVQQFKQKVASAS